MLLFYDAGINNYAKVVIFVIIHTFTTNCALLKKFIKFHNTHRV